MPSNQKNSSYFRILLLDLLGTQSTVQWIELLLIETTYIFKTFHWNTLHRKEVQCNSMNKNLDLCSAVECTAAHPRLTKSPKEEEKSLYAFFCISAFISIGQEIWCIPYAGFFSLFKTEYSKQMKYVFLNVLFKFL